MQMNAQQQQQMMQMMQQQQMRNPNGQPQQMPPAQNMMMAPPSREPLKLNLTNKERGYFSALLEQANPSGDNKVAGREAVMFFKKSGLPVDNLKEFWRIASRTSPEYLIKEEFYVCLRLIAYAQNGITPSEESIKLNIEAPNLPTFDSGSSAPNMTQQSNSGGMPSSDMINQNMEGMGGRQPNKPFIKEDTASIPSLDDLDFTGGSDSQQTSIMPEMKQDFQNQPLQDQASMFGGQQRQQQEQMQQMQNQQMQQNQPQQQQQQQQPQQQNSQQSIWFLEDKDKDIYSKIFDHISQGQNSLSAEQMQGLMQQSQLPKEACAQVWELSNPQGDDKFNRAMFYMAMHFMYKKKMNNDLPKEVPTEMVMSLQKEIEENSSNMSAQKQKDESKELSLDSLSLDQPIISNMNKNGSNSGSRGASPRNPSFGNNQKNMLNVQPQMSPVAAVQISPRISNVSQSNQSQSMLSDQQIEQRQSEVEFMKQVRNQNAQSLNMMQGMSSDLQKKIQMLNQEYANLQIEIQQQNKMLEKEKQEVKDYWAQYDQSYNQVSTARKSLQSITDDRVKNQQAYYGSSSQGGNYQDGRRESLRSVNKSDSYNKDSGYDNDNNPQYDQGYDNYNNYGTSSYNNNQYDNTNQTSNQADPSSNYNYDYGGGSNAANQNQQNFDFN